MNIYDVLEEHKQLIDKTFTEKFNSEILQVGNLISQKLMLGGKVILFGNGGSAADAQHISAEFISKLSVERKSLAALALTVDTSSITAIGNDYSFNYIFARQIESLCKPDDVVIGISTSGNSQNVITGLQAADYIGATSIGLTGKEGFDKYSPKYLFSVKGKNTARIQEIHIIIGHLLCAEAEKPFV